MDISNVTVPGATIVCIFITLAISVILPIALMIIWAVKTKSKILPVLFGAGTFVVFALILEALVHQLVLKIVGQDTFTSLPFYAIYGGLAAGIFEECGRYIVMRFLMKKNLGKKESIMFGIGHGGIESILTLGATYAGNLYIIFMINSGASDLLFGAMDETLKAQAIAQFSPLWTEPSTYFLWGALERISAITFHICASYLVYRAVKYSKPLLLVLAVLLHAFMDGVMAVIVRLTGSTALTEASIAVFAIIFAVFTVIAYRKEHEAITE